MSIDEEGEETKLEIKYQSVTPCRGGWDLGILDSKAENKFSVKSNQLLGQVDFHLLEIGFQL